MITLRSPIYEFLPVDTDDISETTAKGTFKNIGLINGFLFAKFDQSADNYAAADERQILVTQTDLAEYTKDSSTFTKGAKIYYDVDNAYATSTASGNVHVGYCKSPAATGASTVVGSFANSGVL